jgi:sulfur-oxidizing protein SoxY
VSPPAAIGHDPGRSRSRSRSRSGSSSSSSSRRRLLGVGPAVVVLAALPARPHPARAGQGLDAAVAAFTGGRTVTSGRVRLEIAELVENGNAIPVSVKVDSPMTEADHVRRIGLFNEKNPQNDIAGFEIGPRAGRAEVATRIRLATSQKVVAIAEMSDGSFWSSSLDVIVMLAACIE